MKASLKKKIWNTIGIRLWALSKVRMLHWVRPTVEELTDSRAVVSIPLNCRTKNHFNSMYIGSLVCGADLASGLLALSIVKNKGSKASVIFKDIKGDFLKRPEAKTYFTCDSGDIILKAIEKVIATGERVNQTVKVVATCPDKSGNEPVAIFHMTLSLKKTK